MFVTYSTRHPFVEWISSFPGTAPDHNQHFGGNWLYPWPCQSPGTDWLFQSDWLFRCWLVVSTLNCVLMEHSWAFLYTAKRRVTYRFPSDHRSQAPSSGVSTWMGDQPGTPRAVCNINFGALDTWRSRELRSAECASLTTRILHNSPPQSVTGVWT